LAQIPICVAETACIYLESITLTLVTTTRVEGEEEALSVRCGSHLKMKVHRAGSDMHRV